MRQQQLVSVNSCSIFHTELRFKVFFIWFGQLIIFYHIFIIFFVIIMWISSNIFDCWSSQQEKKNPFLVQIQCIFFSPDTRFFSKLFYSKQMKQTKLKEKEGECVNKQRKMTVVMMKLFFFMCNVNEHRARNLNIIFFPLNLFL